VSLKQGAAPAGDVAVSAAASLTIDAFKAIRRAFEVQHPGTEVRFNFTPSDAHSFDLDWLNAAAICAVCDNCDTSIGFCRSDGISCTITSPFGGGLPK